MRTDSEFLDEMRQVGDRKADELVTSIFKSNKQTELYTYLQLPEEQIHQDDNAPYIRDFLITSLEKPKWYDDEKLKRGQLFFRKYALDIMTLLGAKSLPYCYAATPGNKAIYFTGKMRKSPGKRLLDTAQFIISVLQEGSFDESGFAYIQINKTRIIHAMVRYYIQTKTAWETAWGTPVNQEDMAGTNLAFSYIILAGMEQANFPITTQEKEDFLYTWRYIGYQLNIQEELLPANEKEACLLEEAIRKRHFKNSEEGKLLMNELVSHYKESFPAVPAYFIDGQIRYFIGREIASLLGMKPEPVKDFIVQTMNKLKEKLNQKYIHPAAYETMLKNHAKLKAKYA